MRALSNMPISFPGLFGDWELTASPVAIDIGNGIYWYGIFIAAGLLLAFNFALGSETVWSCLALGAVAVEVLLSAWLTRKL